MKRLLPRLLLSLIITGAKLTAQEAWILEMPNKYSDYLIKKSVAEEHDTVAGIIGKLPGLVTKKQIREVDLIAWNAEGGKINQKREINDGGRIFKAGARYYSISGQKPDFRKIKISDIPTKPNFELSTYGFLPRAWTPTFAHRKGNLTLLVLERDINSPTATVSLKNMRQIEFDAGETKESVSWYSADQLDTKELSYSSTIALAANPKVQFITRIFSELKKEGDSLLRIEASSGSLTATESITLHHNEAKFEGHSQTTGPLKKETIKIADKSYTKEGEAGAWALNLTSGE
ncbi:MAG: hypothetical protein EVB10_01965 [Verrucomicrobiaceae bacterium]|jgi:hypothetical protein|nr:MAG: hypothetical protein EVB10_01965 [Verrucomicrobiaceae bacterium]